MGHDAITVLGPFHVDLDAVLPEYAPVTQADQEDCRPPSLPTNMLRSTTCRMAYSISASSIPCLRALGSLSNVPIYGELPQLVRHVFISPMSAREPDPTGHPAGPYPGVKGGRLGASNGS